MNCAKLSHESPLSKLELEPRLNTVLGVAHLKTIGDLTKLCHCGVLDISGVGWKALTAINDALQDAGFRLNSKCQKKTYDE
jgi:DNA-directed RNA polymerase alpha subunit